MSKSGSDKKVANSLVAVSCAAVLSVYAAGYSRTRAAASQFDAQSAERRPSAPDQARTASPAQELTAVPPASISATSPFIPEREEPAVVASRESSPAPVDVAPAAAVAIVAPPSVEVASVPAAVVVVATPVPVAPPTPEPVAAPAAPKWKDGSFTGWGTSRHGDIQAQVVIEAGRIRAATIIECNTRYSCDVIDMLPPQVAVRQSADVDYVSRATESANAFYYAVVEALNKAK